MLLSGGQISLSCEDTEVISTVWPHSLHTSSVLSLHSSYLQNIHQIVFTAF